MVRVAGEIADGVMLWLCNPSYITDAAVPAVRAGREARRQADRRIRDRGRGPGSPYRTMTPGCMRRFAASC
jgi:hypothetical protein